MAIKTFIPKSKAVLPSREATSYNFEAAYSNTGVTVDSVSFTMVTFQFPTIVMFREIQFSGSYFVAATGAAKASQPLVTSQVIAVANAPTLSSFPPSYSFGVASAALGISLSGLLNTEDLRYAPSVPVYIPPNIDFQVTVIVRFFATTLAGDQLNLQSRLIFETFK